MFKTVAIVLAFLAGAPEEMLAPSERHTIDHYLYLTYLVTPKVDKTGNFAWKDPEAANFAGMSLKQFVIGCMHPEVKYRLYYALTAAEEDGYQPGITSGFRNDYRQHIAKGKKAQDDRTYHGGSKRGGCGYGQAIDLVSLNTPSAELWKRFDTHYGPKYWLVRVYGEGDPMHIGPREGPEAMARLSKSFKPSRAVAFNSKLARGKHRLPKHSRKT